MMFVQMGVLLTRLSGALHAASLARADLDFAASAAVHTQGLCAVAATSSQSEEALFQNGLSDFRAASGWRREAVESDRRSATDVPSAGRSCKENGQVKDMLAFLSAASEVPALRSCKTGVP